MAGPGKPENLKPWQPGQSGNPNGRPATKYIEEEFQAFLRELAKSKDGTERERLQVIMARLFHDAANGNVKASTELLNRAFGKAKQDINLGGQKDNPVGLALEGLTLEELKALAKLGGQ